MTDLKQLFRSKQDELVARLRAGSNALSHPSALGDATELDWHGMLAEFLPKRYSVSKATVVDCLGNASEETDLVIYDQHYSPLLFHRAGRDFIAAESVIAVIEVKQDLTKGHFEYAADKARSVRRLHRTSASFGTATGHAAAVQPPPILAGLIAGRSSWTEPFGTAFSKALRQTWQSPDTQIDFGCALDDGTFDAHERGSDGSPDVQLRGPDIALTGFLLTLLSRLQCWGTVPAIDFTQWSDAVLPDA